MGRSAGDSDSRVGAAVAAQAWEAVRRALGKWVTRTEVRALPSGSMLSLPAVPDDDLLTGPEPGQGLREWECRPEARVLTHLAPDAPPGGEGVDLAAVITIVSGDAALGDGDCLVHETPVAPSAAQIYSPAPGKWEAGAIDIHDARTALAGGACRALKFSAMSAPKVGRLATVLPKFARAPKIPRLGGGPDGLPRPRRMVIRNGMGVISRIPLVRRSIAVDRSTPAAHPEERARLAVTGKTTPDRVLVVGMFPSVPVAAVSRLALEPDGNELRIWLKPDAIVAGAPPKMLTLLVGRDRESGKTIQTVL
ncbi:hypothetical protein CCAX7_64340 [Capsulimonas corticalis]|uniref:Uncharacterized protein n=1 Tax=Capsulimonas corticalis TaxID=2219043 RepID=A0A402CQW5_9BACT|nr:hypothetical protein [Capsulimonas corticalis]BDI34383.1 hypothetical protein CCAX7_64340 [Capsulimonas corticalis]